jgi:MFS family permease
MRLTTHPLFSRNLVVATGTAFCNVVGNGLWSALLPLHYRALGASDAEIGLAFTLSILAMTVLQLLGGVLADRLGRRLVLSVMFLNAPLFIIAGLARDWHVVLFAYSGTRMLMGAQWPAMFALISEAVPREAQGKAFGVFEFAIGLGASIGPAIGALLLEQFGFGIGSLMVIHGVIIGCTAVARGILMRERPRGAPPSARQLGAAISPDVRWYIVSLCLYSIVETLTLSGPFFTLYLHDVWGATAADINLLNSGGSFSAMLIGLWGGHWTDRAGGRPVIIRSSLALAAVLAAWVLAPNLLWGLAPVLGLFVVIQVLVVAQSALMSHLTAPETRSSMVGLMGTAQALAGSTGPILGAALVPLLGPGAPFALAALIILFSAQAVRRVST